ncbi:Molybdate-anion transporter [Perkinsus chesapeaki]|uniref:Molybdate-anion transporter n=1 Tax=Perkinsus chesapeaki TaxID=330153 RepID=A0A7J6LFU5_PERCH|nr:Molybdate-anion transporter [Perkinsus chesapeaki]
MSASETCLYEHPERLQDCPALEHVQESNIIATQSVDLVSTFLVYFAANRAKQRTMEDADMIKSNRVSFSLHPLQRKYLTVYVLAMLSDWLQGPYVYALYESYGFDRHQNASLFVCGFASSMILGTFVGSFADRYGRRRFCLLYCWLYIASCLTKHISLYPVLMIGRLLGGTATSLLFSVFESWFICEATTSNQSDLVPSTLGVAVALNSATAILAGVLAQASVSLAPMREITPVFKIAGYIFVFMWTPALEQANSGVTVSLGLVFASFMTSCTLGSQIFRYSRVVPSFNQSVVGTLRIVCLLALISQASVLMWPSLPWSVMVCFLAFEASVGVYYPTMGTLKAQIVPESHRSTMYNLFRVPLNLIVVGALLVKLEVAEAFAVTSVLLFCALALSLRIQNPSQTTGGQLRPTWSVRVS